MFAKCTFLFILFSFALCIHYLPVVTMQHVGVTSVCEVHKYPADIGKYEFVFHALPPYTAYACHDVDFKIYCKHS